MMMTDFERIYKAYADKVNMALEQCVPVGTPEPLASAMRYSLLSGGKRLRAVLTLAFYEANGGKTDSEIVPFACAIEIIHAYSLIHDDMPEMDNSDMRRGKPSCHAAYGSDTALLAGDALCALGFDVALSGTAKPERVVIALKELASAAGAVGMCGGQCLDLQNLGEFDADALLHLNDLKTGAIIRAAAKCGAIIAGSDSAAADNADKYAINLARAFQITDDILDMTSQESKLGKPVGIDEKNGKLTYASLAGLEESRKALAKFTEDAKLYVPEGFLRELADKLANRGK
jgi:geranylgeranyl diphosphate synthase type II